MASLYRRKNSPFYWIKYRDKGRLRQESTRFRVGIAAEARKARELEAQKSLAELQSPAVRHGWEWVSEFLDVRYHSSPLTLTRYRYVWNTVRMFLDEKQILSPAHVTRDHCYDYVSWRSNPDIKNGKLRATRNTALSELVILGVIMREAVTRGMTPANPCYRLGIKQDKPRRRAEITQEDCRAILKAITKVTNRDEKRMLEVSFEIARYQGCRLMETRLDPMTDVDLAGGIIRFRIKGGRVFTTILHPKLVPLFKRLQNKRCSLTWDTPRGRLGTWAAGCWHNLLKREGLTAKGITFHSTRVTVVTQLARNNVPMSKAKAYVGHASSIIHETYQRLRPDDLSDCVRVVG